MRRLDLDDPRPKVGKKRRGGGPGDIHREAHHRQPVERRGAALRLRSVRRQMHGRAAVAQVGEHGFRVRHRYRGRGGAAREVDGRAHTPACAGVRVVTGKRDTAMNDLRVIEELAACKDGSDGKIAGVERRQPMTNRLGGEVAGEDSRHFLEVLRRYAPRRVIPTRVFEQIESINGNAKLVKEHVVAAGQQEPSPVGRSVQAKQGVRTLWQAFPSRHRRYLTPRHRLPGLHRQRGREQRDLDLLAAIFRSAGQERRRDPAAAQDGRRIAANGQRQEDGRRPTPSLVAVDPRVGGDDGLVGGNARQGAPRRKVRERGANQARVHRAQPLVVPPRQDRRHAAVVNENVRRRERSGQHHVVVGRANGAPLPTVEGFTGVSSPAIGRLRVESQDPCADGLEQRRRVRAGKPSRDVYGQHMRQ